MSNPNARITVTEIFGPTTNGEGALTGQLTVFVRTGGCDYQHCSWCLGPNTLIKLSNGKQKKMIDILPGDELLSWDEKTGKITKTTVSHKATIKDKENWTLTVTTSPNGKGGKRKVVCSKDHRWYTKRGWVHTEDLTTKDVILVSHDFILGSSLSNKDNFRLAASNRMKASNPMKNPEVAKKVSQKMKTIWTQEKRDKQREIHMNISQHRENMLGDKNPMRNPETVAKQVASRSWNPSSYEKRVMRIIDDLQLPFQHSNMRYKYKLANGRYKYPDFVAIGANKVIEVYDPTYKEPHEEKTRGERGYKDVVEKLYDEIGVQCLAIEVMPGISDENIGKRISEFAMNGYYVESVKPMSNKANANFGGKPDLYDIECHPYPTFFANHMLTHNCDSLHAVLPEFAKNWKKYTTGELIELVIKQSNNVPMNITLSGGNPALQPFSNFIDSVHKLGYTVSCETQGTHHPDWLGKLDWLVLSPKPPSSLMTTDYELLTKCIEVGQKREFSAFPNAVSLKVVVMDEFDYEYAVNIALRYPNIPFFFSVGNDNPPIVSDGHQYGGTEFIVNSIINRTEWLIQKLANDRRMSGRNAKIIPQVHTLLWKNKQGV